MTFTKKIKQLKLLHELISEEKTGTPIAFAKYLCISRAALYLLIYDLKQKELPIIYSRKKKSFIYTKKVNLKHDLSFEIIKNEHDLSNINGGFVAHMLPSNYMDGRSFIFVPYLQI